MKNMAMTVFMLWMVGNQLSMWTIMMIIAFASTPIQALLNINKSFEMFEGKKVNLLMPKLTFFALNMLLFGGVIYKFSIMGILPVTPSDWNVLIEAKHPIESGHVLVFN
jgi:hypothetical protein